MTTQPGLSQPPGHASDDAARLTARAALLILVATLALFVGAYSVAGVFGRAADRGANQVGNVAAVQPFGTPDLSIEAKSVTFSTDAITVAAGRPLQLRLDNQDAGILHNVAIYRDSTVTAVIQRGALFDGPTTRDYRFDAFEAGSYYFRCDLHPSMNGTFIAQ